MNPILILREEAVCLCILLFLLVYSRTNIRENRFYLRLTLFGIGHVIFDFITIYTVNHLETVPLWLNGLCHALFYIFAILCCCELLRFVLNMVYGDRIPERRQRLVYLLPVSYFALIPVLPIDYLQGSGSNYSYGICVFVGYGLAVAIFLVSEVLLLTHYSMLTQNAKRALVPGFLMMTAGVLLQAIIPELLFTGGAVTLVDASVFLTVADPAEKFRRQAFRDASLNIDNRNAYTQEMIRFSQIPVSALQARGFSVAMFDMNGLKYVNDHFGHAAGDAYLRAVADILQSSLRSAHGIYRTGGDEFVALYLEKKDSVIQREVTDAAASCATRDMGYDHPLSISWGWAAIEAGDSVYTVENRADERMLSHKRRIYAEGTLKMPPRSLRLQ